MRNLFVKNYVAYACLILISFCLVGVAFAVQINQYSLEEKQELLESTATRATDLTELLFLNYSLQMDQFYQLNLQQLAEANQMAILLTDAEGNVIMRADGNQSVDENVTSVSRAAVRQIRNEDSYAEMGSLGGAFLESSYVVGRGCWLSEEEPTAMIFVATSASAAVDLMQQVMRIFIGIVTLTLVVTLLISFFISGRMTRPLKTMAIATKRFAHGDFSVRVPENNNSDEIDELAISFNNMARALEQSDELSRDFVANVSHELKTPMTSIGGFVDGMLDGTIPPEKHQKYLEIISQEIKRLSRLVMRMLGAAKLQSGELTLNPAPFDLCELASRIILSFEQVINEKKIQVEIDFADRLVVNGDSDQIFQVIYNLVDNAVKFTEENGKLSLSIRKLGSRARFAISNTGNTIPSEALPHVFDRFYKVDRSRSRDKPGSGLGLYIAKTIVNLHGGDISVKSEDGVTEFAFTLPQVTKA